MESCHISCRSIKTRPVIRFFSQFTVLGSMSESNRSPNVDRKHATIGLTRLKAARQLKVIKRTDGFTLDDSLDILGIEDEEKFALKDDLAAEVMTRKRLFSIADRLPDEWDDVLSIVEHLEPRISQDVLSTVHEYHLSNAG